MFNKVAGSLVVLMSIAAVGRAANRTLLYTATVEIFNATNYGTTSLGNLTMKQYREPSSRPEVSDVVYVEITGNLSSIYPTAPHGFHIHESAPTSSSGCTALGKHYNPFTVEHGAPNGTVQTRHVGDLGNVMSDESGNVRVSIRDNIVQVGTHDVTFDTAGKAIAVHIGIDDLGFGGTNVSKSTGNAGTIMACGAIVLQSTSSAVQNVPVPVILATLEAFLFAAAAMLF